jgi:hypothetical protein
VFLPCIMPQNPSCNGICRGSYFDANTLFPTRGAPKLYMEIEGRGRPGGGLYIQGAMLRLPQCMVHVHAHCVDLAALHCEPGTYITMVHLLGLYTAAPEVPVCCMLHLRSVVCSTEVLCMM